MSGQNIVTPSAENIAASVSAATRGKGLPQFTYGTHRSAAIWTSELHGMAPGSTLAPPLADQRL